MKCNPLVKTALVILGIAIAIFLSCSSGPILEFPSLEDVQGYSSSSSEVYSSSADSSSSEAELDSSSSAESSSSSEETYSSSSSSEEASSSSSCYDADKCGGKCYNKETHFCYDTDIVDKCGGDKYILFIHMCCGNAVYPKSDYGCCGETSYLLSNYGCRGNAVLTKCGAEGLYDKQEQFCTSDYKVIPLCGGSGGMPYSPPGEWCIEGEVGGVCGTETIEYSTHFCHGGVPYARCGGETYNPDKQFCSVFGVRDKCNVDNYDPAVEFCFGITIYDKCGGNDYNPSTHFCDNGTIHDRCGGEPYNPSTQFCHTDNTIKDKCGGTVAFTPGTEQCCGSSKYTVATQFCYNSSDSKVGDFCGINPQRLYDPDLYECKPPSNGIYLRGGITDGRDNNKHYKAVLMGEQVWMAENLNYKTTDGTSRCYPTSGNTNTSDADNANCSTYGRLYTWATAMNLASSYNSATFTVPAKHQGICPSGWHIPSSADWYALVKFVNPNCSDISINKILCANAGIKLKAASGWSSGNGTDDYGFSVLAGGFGYSGNRFEDAGIQAPLRSSLQSNIYYAYQMYIRQVEDAEWNAGYKDFFFGVRCLQD